MVNSQTQGGRSHPQANSLVISDSPLFEPEMIIMTVGRKEGSEKKTKI
jgi:hypothetical protein